MQKRGLLNVPNRKYKTIVIDPPWNQGKTGLRSVRPNQDRNLPYKIMTLEEIKDFNINKFAQEECLIFLWTTDKYIEEAHKILREWSFKKHCIFVWNKNTGVCPFSVQFRNEYCIMGYRGKLKLNKIGVPTSFFAKVREHSRKPDEFYEIVKQIADSPRIDIFSREKREGFDQWGDEIDRFTEISAV
jgi:N6-adenosine-specific RNA methylase IME4